jgi:hypothetical protein
MGHKVGGEGQLRVQEIRVLSSDIGCLKQREDFSDPGLLPGEVVAPESLQFLLVVLLQLEQ